MEVSMMKYLIFFSLIFPVVYTGDNGKVRLSDIQALTLYSGKMTAHRRVSPIPQLNCVGGNARCKYTPNVVQCYNKGSDGFDVQWECKADMENPYQFGRIEVICEGYDYPEDKYVLKGSCGLEYTIDLNRAGYTQKERNYRNSYQEKENYHSHVPKFLKGSSRLGDILTLLIIGIIIYAIYATCLSSSQYQYSSTNNDAPHDQGQNGGGGWFGNAFGNAPGTGAPPPYGFRPEHYNAGCGGSQPRNQRNRFGGFWTGAATGGLLGYMFGNRNGQATGNQGYQPHTDNNSWWGGFGNQGYQSRSTGGDYSGGSSSSSSSHSNYDNNGTRTTSGFGGTRRR